MEPATQILTEDAVYSLFRSTIFRQKEIVDGKPIVKPKIGEGVTQIFHFCPNKIEAKREEIKGLLLQLPSEFMESAGKGWSFMNANITNNNVQWTSLTERIEQLFAMGNALGLLEYQHPREMWKILPNGMPYVVIKT